jgi:asparagine synthase (glutamine-hydrolysing)
MCGIAGCINGDIIYNSLAVDGMLYHQIKRGPDNESTCNQSIYNNGSVALGHNRLSILDLSENGNQPMASNSGRYILTYNGEIYNFKDFHPYATNDARAYLNHIERVGHEHALQNANGMYAYCLYDAVLKQINLVVDRFGQKPLYYCHFGANFAFASSVGALMQLRDKWSIDQDGLQSYWLLGSTMGDNSMISGIKRLTGSHHLIYDIEANTVKIERYWQPTFQENTSGIEDLVLDAINKVKIADVPVYVFLSGGIDSTLVASQCPGMNAVHLDGPEYKYALETADKFGMNLITVDPQNIDVIECLKDYAVQSGEPSMAALIPYVTARGTSKHAKVAISANGADELFFGYDRTTENISEKQRKHIFRASINEHYWPHFIDRYDPMISLGRWVELTTYVQFDLNKTLDAASMCHSLEVRSPFLDHRLVEMALSIPEVRHYDSRLGRKAILKRMLQKMGFGNEFLTRPKLGFSLHREPAGMEALKDQAWKFCKENGFLKCDDSKLSGRDERYLKASALSFWVWHKTWEHKL